MATKTLIEKIEALPAEKKAEVEHFVDALAEPTPPDAGGLGLVERLRAHRQRLLLKHGLVDSVPLIRQLRENH